MKLHKTWWGEAFVQSLNRFIDEGRLQRGKAYRGDNRILSFNIDANQVEATLRGNINPYFGVYKEPKYNVKLVFKKINLEEWKTIIQTICEHPGWLAKLMLNEIPSDIAKAFVQHSLLPEKYSDIDATCSCPDDANPCKHIAGVYFRLATIFDSNPMLLFPLRGISIESLQAELKKNELGAMFAEHLASSQEIVLDISNHYYQPIIDKVSAITYTQHNYWDMPTWQLDVLETTPSVNAAIIKKQGDYPSFWPRPNSFVNAMEQIYHYACTKNQKALL